MHDLTLAIAVIVALGLTAQIIADRLRVPAIMPLLLTGFAVGPGLQIVKPEELFGHGLETFVALAVGVILFEGGLTLRLPEIRGHGRAVTRLITLGSLVTWVLAAVAAHYVAGISWMIAVVFGALVIVTGPTVVGPLLRNVRTSANTQRVLKWEGILIDPVGALAALLAFEAVRHFEPGELLGNLASFLLVGGLIGAVSGLLLAWTLRRELLPDRLLNVTALALVFLTLAGSNALVEESGLLAVTLMGVVIANARIPRMEELLIFKEHLVAMLIATLFIVLAANVEREALLAALALPNLILLLVLVLVVRPAAVLLSTIRTRLSVRERLFISFVGPRGIVAAAVSSLIALRLQEAGVPGAELLVPLVFTVIVGTVVLSSLFTKPVGRALGVLLPEPHGFLFVGAHALARELAGVLDSENVPVVLADTNPGNVRAARLKGLRAHYGSLLSERSDEELDLTGIGKLLALTPNDEANALTSLKYARLFGHRNIHQLRPARHNDRNTLQRERRANLAFERCPTSEELTLQYASGHSIRRTTLTSEYGIEAWREANPGGRVLFYTQGDVFVVAPPDLPDLPPGTRIIALAPPRPTA